VTAKFKGIYHMIASKELIGKDQSAKLTRQGFQTLVDSNTFFKMFWIQARKEGPKFYEGTQQIQQKNQPFKEVVANFKEWVKKQGIKFSENRWDSYFFHTTTSDPKAAGWKRYFLVFYHTAGGLLIDYSSFVVDYTMAAKEGNSAKLKQLLNKSVSCQTCGKVVDPALRAAKKGFLECPFCGQWWTKALK